MEMRIFLDHALFGNKYSMMIYSMNNRTTESTYVYVSWSEHLHGYTLNGSACIDAFEIIERNTKDCLGVNRPLLDLPSVPRNSVSKSERQPRDSLHSQRRCTGSSFLAILNFLISFGIILFCSLTSFWIPIPIHIHEVIGEVQRESIF